MSPIQKLGAFFVLLLFGWFIWSVIQMPTKKEAAIELKEKPKEIVYWKYQSLKFKFEEPKYLLAKRFAHECLDNDGIIDEEEFEKIEAMMKILDQREEQAKDDIRTAEEREQLKKSVAE